MVQVWMRSVSTRAAAASFELTDFHGNALSDGADVSGSNAAMRRARSPEQCRKIQPDLRLRR
jgi:hypothetical protein